MAEPRGVIVYSIGLVACSACAPADMTAEEVVAEVNRVVLPTGIESPWSVSADPAFKGGEPNPGPCDRQEGRRHWLLEC